MMRIVCTVAACFVLSLGALACESDTVDLEKRVDEANEKLDVLIGHVEKAQGPPKPDPKTVYAVPLGDSPYVGEKHAKITIVEAYEFACPYCEKANAIIEEVVGSYGADVKVVYRNFLVHPEVALTPALAACAANQQDSFSSMSALIWEEGFKKKDLSEEKMVALATELGLDIEAFESDMNGETCKKRVEQDHQEMSAVGTSGTPNFYINGRPISGAQPLANFKRVIDEELSKADKALAAGTRVEDYYQEYVVKRGKKSI